MNTKLLYTSDKNGMIPNKIYFRKCTVESTNEPQELPSNNLSYAKVSNRCFTYTSSIFNGRYKYMDHFPSMCCSSPLNTQVLFYVVRGNHFYDRELNILCRQNIQSSILKEGDSVHDHTKYIGPKKKLNILYGNSIMKWMRYHVTLNFTPTQMNYVLVEIWEAFKYNLQQ